MRKREYLGSVGKVSDWRVGGARRLECGDPPSDYALVCGRRSGSCRAFSLVELLVVIGIVLIMSAMLLPGFNSIGNSQKLGGAARGLEEMMGNARKSAVAGNRVVELRFRTEPGGTTYTTYEARIFDQFGANPQNLGKSVRLPDGVSFADDTRSTLMSSLTAQPATLPNGQSVTSRSFRFLPDGSTDLALSINWFLTLVNDSSANASANSPMVASVRLDPLTGSIVTYRP